MKKNILFFILGAVSCLTAFIIIGSIQHSNVEPFTPKENAQYYKTQYLSSLYNMAREEFTNRNYEKALKYIIYYNKKSEALDKKPIDKEGSVLCLNKLVQINKNISKNPNSAELYFKRAEILNSPMSFIQKKGTFCADTYNAYNDYNKALKLNPKNAGKIYERRADARFEITNSPIYIEGELHFDINTLKNNAKENISDYKKAIELNGANYELNMKLAQNYYIAGKYKEALEILNSASKDDTKALLGKIYCYYELNNNKETISNINKLLSYNLSDDFLTKRLYELRFQANLKSLHFIQAYKDYKTYKSINVKYTKDGLPIPE